MFDAVMRLVVLKLGHRLPPETLQTAAHTHTFFLFWQLLLTSVLNYYSHTHTEIHKLKSAHKCCCAINLHTHTPLHALVSRWECCCRLTRWRVCLTAVGNTANTQRPFKIFCLDLWLFKGEGWSYSPHRIATSVNDKFNFMNHTWFVNLTAP